MFHEFVLWAWEKIDIDAEMIGSFSKIFQAISKPYVEFLEN